MIESGAAAESEATVTAHSALTGVTNLSHPLHGVAGYCAALDCVGAKVCSLGGIKQYSRHSILGREYKA